MIFMKTANAWVVTCLALIFVLVLVCHALGAQAAELPDISYSSTLRFLQEFRDSYPKELKNWKGGNYCSWPGVDCKNATGAIVTADSPNFDYSKVGVHIKLAGKGLSGRTPAVPDTVDGATVGVVSIDVSDNSDIFGSFSYSWSALSRLQEIIVSGTKLSGPFPSTWSQLTELKALRAVGTKACGGLPDWSNTQFPNLAVVDLTNASLRGPLSDTFATLVTEGKLVDLKMKGNTFCGCLSDTWKNNAVLLKAATEANNNLTFSNCSQALPCNVPCVTEIVPTPRPMNAAQKNWWVFLFLFIGFFFAFVAFTAWYFTNKRDAELVAKEESSLNA